MFSLSSLSVAHVLHVSSKFSSVHTHSCQTAGAFTYCRAAADQADDEEKSPDGDYYHGGDQGVDVFEEVVVVVVCDKYVGADVA